MKNRLYLLFILLLAACQAAEPTSTTTIETVANHTATVAIAEAEPSPTSTDVSTAPAPTEVATQPKTATPAPTETAEATPTEVPTATPEATAEATAIPEAAATVAVQPSSTPEATINSAETLPIVTDFSASHWIVGGGEPLVLSWEVENADGVTLLLMDGTGSWLRPLKLEGAATDSYTIDWPASDFPVPPLQGSNNEYQLTAYNNAGSVDHSIRITHDPSLAADSQLKINSFMLSQYQFEIGDTVTMAWDVEKAERIDFLTVDSGPEGTVMLFSTTEGVGSYQLSYNSFPTYMFESYGLSEMPVIMRAYDAVGAVHESTVQLALLRPASIVSANVTPSVISAGSSVTVEYTVNWAYAVNILLRHPDGEALLDSAFFAEGRPVQPERSSNRVTLTWDDLTQSGAFSPNGGTITLAILVAGGERTVEQIVTIAVE